MRRNVFLVFERRLAKFRTCSESKVVPVINGAGCTGEERVAQRCRRDASHAGSSLLFVLGPRAGSVQTCRRDVK
jgi:hypothetical protein